MLKAKQKDNWCTKLHNFVPRFYSSKKFSVLRWPFCSWYSSFEVQFLGDHLQGMIIMTLIKENKDLKIISHCYWDIQKAYKSLLWVCCRNPPSWGFCSDMCILLWCNNCSCKKVFFCLPFMYVFKKAFAWILSFFFTSTTLTLHLHPPHYYFCLYHLCLQHYCLFNNPEKSKF